MSEARIAIELGSRLWGGAERELARIGAALAARGHTVRFYCNPEHNGELGRRGLDAELHHLGGDAALHHALAFARALRGFRPDALLIGTFRKLWLATLAARFARVPRVIARVGLETDVPRNLKYRIALKRIDGIVVNADAMRSAFEGTVPVTTIYNLHEPLPPADPLRVREELGIGDAPTVGTVARLAAQKRIDRLIDAVAPLEGVQLIVAGDGPERDRLRARAAELQLSRVHLLGHRDDVASVLAALDVFVVASDREGMSSAMIEALSAGVPVVSTPVSGAAEALAPLGNDQAPGIVLDDFEAASLRAAIARLLGDPSLRARMGDAARRVARERFGAARSIDAWESLLVN